MASLPTGRVTQVIGAVVDVKFDGRLPEILNALDEYEGEDFERIARETAGGASDSVWIYRYKKDTPEDSRIASGDFCAP